MQVGKEWFNSLSCGTVPLVSPLTFPPEEADLYLQPSCTIPPPDGWQLLSVHCIPRAPHHDEENTQCKWVLACFNTFLCISFSFIIKCHCITFNFPPLFIIFPFSHFSIFPFLYFFVFSHLFTFPLFLHFFFSFLYPSTSLFDKYFPLLI